MLIKKWINLVWQGKIGRGEYSHNNAEKGLEGWKIARGTNQRGDIAGFFYGIFVFCKCKQREERKRGLKGAAT